MSYIIAENIEKYLENSCDSELKSLVMVEFLSCIDKMPRENVEPIIYANWKINCDGYYPYCSNCGTEPKNGIMTKRCPECGAYMSKYNKE